MPFYLLALFLAPATIYFRNGNDARDVQLWINVVLFFPIVFHGLGHMIAIIHAWYFIYHHSDITGREGNGYLDRLQFNSEPSPVVTPINSAPHIPDYNDQAGASSAAAHVDTLAPEQPAPSYSDSLRDNKAQV